MGLDGEYNEQSRVEVNALMLAFEQAVEQGQALFFAEQEYLDLVEVLLNSNEPDKALVAATQAKDQYPYSAEVNNVLAQVLSAKGQWEEAGELIEQALLLAPNDTELLLTQAELLILQQHTDQALDILYRLQEQPLAIEYQTGAWQLRALAYETKGDYPATLDALQQALLIDPTDQSILLRLRLCVSQGQLQREAVDVYERLLDENPYADRVWFLLGEVHAYLGQEFEAMEAYEYAFLVDEKFEDAYFEYADLCMANGLYERALEVFKEIGDRFTVDSFVLQQQGDCFMALERYDTARHYLEQAARLEPHNDEVIFRLGKCYAAQEKWTKAKAFFQKAIRMVPECEDYHAALARAAFQLDDLAIAEVAYRKAVDINPDNYSTWLELAWFLLETMRPQEAQSVLGEANETLIEAELMYSYIACFFINGQRQEGLHRLGMLLVELHDQHEWLYEWLPSLRHDAEVQHLIATYALK